MAKEGTSLFDIITALFNNKELISSLSNETINQNSFMINRRLAINYPLQAQVFNNSKVNPVDVLKFWSDYLYNGSLAPRWVYTKGAVKSQAKKESTNEFSKATVKAYCNKYGYSLKDIDACFKFFPEEISSELRDFEKYIKQIKNEECNY